MHPLASAPETELKMPQPQVQHVENVQMDLQTQPVSSPTTTGSENDEFFPLSGRPSFHVVLIKAHLKPSYQMFLPTKMHPVLPCATIPVVLSYRGKNWEMVYYGDRSGKRFDSNWKTFIIDNDLKLGDACVFELMECNSKNVKFRVQILRGDFPSELLARVNGESSNTPIIID
ncbi:B3 domain-containing protein Os04g0386900-like [Cornus florida]|uniref:B3 domain-containing protein Os04g0386900-like n=1 Tax=Cornus florida TaxID=4283 RepID=UPI00289D1233|nr:B3 domain-containing protein Os04g0386900-like [Cornus florida]